LLAVGLGVFSMDMPGTGECPVCVHLDRCLRKADAPREGPSKAGSGAGLEAELEFGARGSGGVRRHPGGAFGRPPAAPDCDVKCLFDHDPNQILRQEKN
jgi:hypothetical protein